MIESSPLCSNIYSRNLVYVIFNNSIYFTIFQFRQVIRKYCCCCMRKDTKRNVDPMELDDPLPEKLLDTVVCLYSGLSWYSLLGITGHFMSSTHSNNIGYLY